MKAEEMRILGPGHGVRKPREASWIYPEASGSDEFAIKVGERGIRRILVYEERGDMGLVMWVLVETSSGAWHAPARFYSIGFDADEKEGE